MDAKQAAQMIFDKLQNADTKRRIAVFIKGTDGVLMTGPKTGLFNEAMTKIPRDLMGVYDRDATLQWLVSDLLFMGMAG